MGENDRRRGLYPEIVGREAVWWMTIKAGHRIHLVGIELEKPG